MNAPVPSNEVHLILDPDDLVHVDWSADLALIKTTLDGEAES